MRGGSFDWTRRDFLVTVGAGVTLGALRGPSWLAAAAAGSPRDRMLVILELTGGNDALNMVIPYADDLYHRARPQLRIPASEVLALDDRFGLHPRMPELRALHDEGSLAIVHGVGYDRPDRSHFRALDIWHSADPESARPTTGWIGRAAESTASPKWPGTGSAIRTGTGSAGTPEVPVPSPAVPAPRREDDRGSGSRSGTGTGTGTGRDGVERTSPFAWRVGGRDLPLVLRGRGTDTPTLDRLSDLRWELGAAGPAAARRAVQERLLSGSGGEASPSPREQVRRAWLGALRDAERLGASIDGESAAEYPPSELARRLSLAAAILGSPLEPRVVYVNHTGYDTHASQSAPHGLLLGELSSSLGAFFADLRARGLAERVLVVVYSEFGRRVAENSSAGTDHGAAAPVLLLSGALRGGLHGEPPSLADLDDGDLKHSIDFRRVYATLLEPWLGIPAAPILGDGFRPLAVV